MFEQRIRLTMNNFSIEEQNQRMQMAAQGVTRLIEHIEQDATIHTKDHLLVQAQALIGHLVEEAEEYKRMLHAQLLEGSQDSEATPK